MNTTHDAPSCGKKGGKSRYRYITLVAPMSAHDALQGRQRNMKLYHVLRWFLYTQPHGSNFHSVPTSSAALPYGAQCLRARCDVSRDAFLQSPAVQELLQQLREEKLTPCLYLFDGFADGADKPLPVIVICGHTPSNRLQASEISLGPSFNRGHVPTFARQMLQAGKRLAAESLICEESAYRHHFGL